MKGNLAMHQSPRCVATSKRTRLPCQAPAVTGWIVCWFHGAVGSPKGEGNGTYRHGPHTAAAVAERRALTDLLPEAKAGMAHGRREM